MNHNQFRLGHNLAFVAQTVFLFAFVAGAFVPRILASTTVLLGNQTVETTPDSEVSGTADAFVGTATTSGMVGSLAVYLDASSTATQLIVGLYGNSGQNPGGLLSQGSSTALVAGAWNTITIPQISVTAGTAYWIAVLGTGGTLYYRDTTGSCTSQESTQTTLTALPATWSSAAGQHEGRCLISAYGNASTSVPTASGENLFTTQTPAELNVSDGAGINYELGTVFTSDIAGSVTALRFWKTSSETGTHTGHLWNTSGQLLATATFSNETASGWQLESLATPVQITASTQYVVSVNTGNTYYAVSTLGLASAIANQDLKSVVGNNGVYGSPGGYPTNSYSSSNYFRDVFFTPTIAATTYSISGTVGPSSSDGTGTTLALTGTGSATATADSSGNYTFSGLANGTYTVTASKPGYIFTPVSQIVTVSGTSVSGMNFTATLVPTYSISGTITNGGGATVALSGAASASVTANASGGYTLSGLQDGNYTITPNHTGYSISPASQVVTISGANIASVNFTASSSALYSISGNVTDGGGSGVAVTLTGSASATVSTDVNGNYTFSGLSGGNYVVTPSEAGVTFSPAIRSITLSGKNATGVNFGEVIIPYSISGSLSLTAGGSGATLTLSGSAAATVVSDSSGNFTFTGLSDGNYTVTPARLGYSFTPASQTVTLNDSTVTGIVFTAVPASNIIFDDEFDGSSLSSAWTALNRQGDYTNNELECYDPAYTQVVGGLMTITTALHSETCGDATNAATLHNYTSGMVMWTNFNFLYGTIEYRAKMAGGQGTWPAIWMLGTNCQAGGILDASGGSTCNWPQPGSDEIDITEIMNGNHTTVGQYIHSGSSNTSCTPTTTDTSANFHVYQLVWAPGSLVWKIDGVTTCTETQSIPSHPMFLMMDTAVGGNGGGSVNNATLPQSLQVDFVTITQ